MTNLLVIAVISLLCTETILAQALILKGDLDPREIRLPQGLKLWSDVEVEKINSRPMRDDIMTNSSLYLENTISQSDFAQFLRTWSEVGFNQQERVILIDTIQKSQMPVQSKNQWLCRLDSQRNCQKIKFITKHLPPILQKYDWLFVDGQAFPRVSWDEIFFSDETISWSFYSSRFETYNFKGKWEDLKLKNPNLADWVTGNCEHYSVHSEIQSLENQVMFNRNCLKPAFIVPSREVSFYDKNKKALWVAAGLVFGISAFNSYSGKKIILEKPSFR